MTASGRATIRGASLAYEITGADDATGGAGEAAGHGLPVIWGHGLTMDRVSDAELGLVHWDRLSVPVVRYDARGHGESASTADLDGYLWSELALDQLALADMLGIDRYVAAGASMGCGTALYAAIAGGSRVAALVLAIPPTAWETRAARAGQLVEEATTVERDGIEAAIASWADDDVADPFRGDRARRAQEAAAARRWEPARLATVLRGSARANLPDRADIAGIDVPALILAWTGDAAHPMSTADELARLLPRAELHVSSTRAEVDTWTDLVGTFLDRLVR